MKSEHNNTSPAPDRKNRLLGFLLQLFFSLAILGCAVALASYYLKTSQKAKPHKREPLPPLVQTTTLHYNSHQIHVTGMGTVISAKEINLTAKVKGEIVTTSNEFIPGGFFTRGDNLLNIDSIDYELIVQQLKNDVVRTKNELELELGNQRIAKRELDLLGQDVSDNEKKLMLRKPQLEIKQSYLDAARAKLIQAELNLSRTHIKAPFSGVLRSRSVNIGSRVSESTILATLVATDEFWVELVIPVNQLKWINIPVNQSQLGSSVRISLQHTSKEESFRTGRVVRLAASLQKEGRMAVVYVAVRDPLSLLPENSNQPKLLLGSYVQARIVGTELTSVITVKRRSLHDNNTLWLLTKKNTLDIRPVKIIAATSDHFILSATIAEGEKLITSDLPVPVNGTPVRPMPAPPDKAGSDNTSKSIRTNSSKEISK